MGEYIYIYSSEKKDAEKGISINHDEFFKQVESGDILKIDFDGAVAKVKEVSERQKIAKCEVMRSGEIKLNRAIDIQNRQ